jgi:hypothetical protein
VLRNLLVVRLLAALSSYLRGVFLLIDALEDSVNLLLKQGSELNAHVFVKVVFVSKFLSEGFGGVTFHDSNPFLDVSKIDIDEQKRLKSFLLQV